MTTEIWTLKLSTDKTYGDALDRELSRFVNNHRRNLGIVAAEDYQPAGGLLLDADALQRLVPSNQTRSVRVSPRWDWRKATDHVRTEAALKAVPEERLACKMPAS